MPPKVGLNLQTLPPSMKPYILPDPGYMLVNVDGSQAENRLVAWLGPVPKMQAAFDADIDVHSETYSLMFGVPRDEVSREKGSAKLGDGVLSQRDVGKKTNHSGNYGISYKTFSINNQLQENVGKDLLRRYHQAYPGVQNNYQSGIKEQMLRTRTLTTPFGRKRKFLGFLNDDAYREGYSFIPQATVAYIINEWGLQPIYYEEMFRDWVLLLQVHDSLLFQVPRPETEEQIDKLVGQFLTLKNSLEQPIPPGVLGSGNSEPLIIPTDFALGLNYGSQTIQNKWGMREIEVNENEEDAKASITDFILNLLSDAVIAELLEEETI